MPTNWTQPQQNAIQARSGALIVSAAAGSGKTAVLTERAVSLLTDAVRPVDADRLLIVTFTNAAAAEMRQRITKRLSELAEASPHDQLLRRQLQRLSYAKICTIDAFCLTLVREHFARLSLSPDCRVADDAELDNLRDRAAAEVIESFYAEADEQFIGLVELISGARDDRNLVKTLLRLHGFILSHPFPSQWLEQKLAMYDENAAVADTPWGRTLLEYAREGYAHAVQLNQTARTLLAQDVPAQAAYGALFQADAAALQALYWAAEGDDWDALFMAARTAAFGRMPALRGAKAVGGPAKQQAQALRSEYLDIVKRVAERVCVSDAAEFREDLIELRPKVQRLFALCMRYDERLSQLKRERNLLDFSDVEHFALKLLAVPVEGGFLPTPLAAELGQRFEEIMVDEYQDTNETQDMLFRAISTDGAHLFLVGDVKQSIYRFRQASPEIFLQRLARARDYDGAAPDARVFLAANFRSGAGVVEAVNFLFAQLMSPALGDVVYDETQQLVCGADRPVEGVPIRFDIVDAGESEDSASLCEARHVASLIRELVESGRLISIDGALRPVRLGDVCILMRAPSARAAVYAEALADAGLESWYEQTGGYFSSREVVTLLALLRVIDNPLQDVPLLALLLSALYPFTPDDVALLRAGAPGQPLYRAVLAAAERGDEACIRLTGDLTHYRRLAASRSTPALLMQIYEETDYLLMVQSASRGAERSNNLRLLLQHAERYSESGGPTLSGFLRFIDRVIERGGDLSGARVLAAPDNAVRIMSIHRSKGLQFPVCIVADTAKAFSTEDIRGATCLHATLGFSTVRRDPERLTQYSTIPHEALHLAVTRDQLSEELRLLYVAATRAESLLLFTAAVSKPAERLTKLAQSLTGTAAISPYALQSARSLFDWLALALLRHPDGAPLREAAQSVCPILPCAAGLACRIVPPAAADAADSSSEAVVLPPADPALTGRLLERLTYCYPYAPIMDFPAKYTVTELVRLEEGLSTASLRRPRFLQQQEGFTAAERGTILHRFLELAVYSAAAVDPEAEAARLAAQQYLTVEELAVLPFAKLRRFFRSALVQEMLAAPLLRREFQFLLPLPVRAFGLTDERFAGERVTVQGVVDCLYGDDSGVTIVDYKSDRADAPAPLIVRYQPQLRLYKAAVERQLGLPVHRCILYSFSLEQAIPIPITQESEALHV